MSPRTLPMAPPRAASVKELRQAVAGLAGRGMQEVTSVRQAFVSGVPPLPTFSSGSKSDFISRFSGPGIEAEITRSTAQFGLGTATVSAPVPPPRPELDLIEVVSDRSKGVLDSFLTRVVFSISTAELPRVSYFRILRARLGRVNAPIPAFSALVDSLPLGSRTKSSEIISNMAFRAAGVGVGNALTTFVADDSFSGQRAVVSSSSLRPLPPVLNTNRRGATSAGLLSVLNGDRSVIENVTFYVNQRTGSPRTSVPDRLSIGQRRGGTILQGTAIGASTSIVSTGNSSNFSELSRVFSSRGSQFGAFTEFEFTDPSVVYGAAYAYYIVAVSSNGSESARTRIGNVSIVRSIPPPAPNVMFAVLGGLPRFSIACSGSFTDHVEVFRRGGLVPGSVSLLSTKKAMIDRGRSTRLGSGFYHIGDIGIGAARSMPFIDRNVSPGQSLEYRIYSVDSFGLKSSTPFSCSVSLPDHGRAVPLPTPSITAEQVPGDRIVRVTVSCEDHRISSFMLSRRELSTAEHAYKQPSDPTHFTFGSTTVLRSRSRAGPSLNQFSSRAWNGVLVAVSGTARFDDRALQFDRVYQYSAHGVDQHGNLTADAPAVPVFVSVKPVSDAPVSVTGTLLADPDGAPTGVLIEWIGGTIDVSPLDLIGDQDALSATSQRSVFQVERRLVGTSAWKTLPATTASHFIDPVSDTSAPTFRPEFASLNSSYDYRVIAMQSGAFISSHTDPVRVSITPQVLPPMLVMVRSAPTFLRPFFVVASWDHNGPFVDGWEVERAVTNKLFGARVPSMDSALARGLAYSSVARVTRESSRALGVSSIERDLDPAVFSGNRFFIDRDVSLANSYFYRIRAFDAMGRTSDWTYGGILLTDSPFDRKFMSSLSDDEKFQLSLDSRPLLGWEGR